MLRRALISSTALAAAILGTPAVAHAAVMPIVTIKYAVLAGTNGSVWSGTATCDAGQVENGGGFWISGSPLSSSSYVSRSYPLNSQSWYVQTNGMAGWVYVSCLSLTNS